MKLLTVDDEKDFGDVIEKYFAPRGYTVFKAMDGQAGLDIAQREVPDVVLIDLKMPGIHGDQVLIELKKLCPTTKMIMITALESDTQVRERLLELGADDCFDKPITSLKNLETKILTLLDAR